VLAYGVGYGRFQPAGEFIGPPVKGGVVQRPNSSCSEYSALGSGTLKSGKTPEQSTQL